MEHKPSAAAFCSGSNNVAEKQENKKFDLDSRNLKFFKEDIFHVPFDKLSDSSNYKHFKHVFFDEDDYEDFKTDLVSFHHVRSRWKDDRKKLSKERPRIVSVLDSSEGDGEESSPFYHHDSHAIQHTAQATQNGASLQNSDSRNLVSNQELDSGEVLQIQRLPLPSRSRSRDRDDHCESEQREFRFRQPPMMEFFQNDEHFQEFDRVFETVKNKRRYASNSSLDKYRLSPCTDGSRGDDVSDEEGEEVFPALKMDDIFSDFFNNDSDFKDFENEFENFQMKRRSQAIERWHRNSVCDLIEDLKAFCDTDDTPPVASSNETTLPIENKLSLPKMWNQGGEWDYIFSKIRRYDKNPSVSSYSDTGRSDLTVKCDSDSGDCLLDEISDGNCYGDTGYYSESSKGQHDNGNTCTACQGQDNHDCQFTCHHQCLPLIQLECKSISCEDGADDEGAVLSGETSLSDLSISNQSTEPLSEPATEKDETDSGYRSGTIPDEKLPPKPSDATLNREELRKRIIEFNRHVPGANFALREDVKDKEDTVEEISAETESETADTGDTHEPFQGFIKVVLNLVRPISMSIGARPPSIYEVLTREHIVEQNTQNISFYMPRDTVRSIHAHSSQTTKEVVTLLLKKFHILDHPRKFALYEQELKNNKIARIRRVKDAEFPLAICLSWDLDNVNNYRLVLQENETGEIDWDAFCVPELNNFMRVLDREQEEYMAQLKYKYKVMKRLILQRMKEIRLETERQKRASMVANESTS